ncbi:hypothetical protein GCM10027074_04050 [Streptomyces deserti]
MARRDFSLRRVESGAGRVGAGWADLCVAMGRIYQLDKTVRLAGEWSAFKRDDPSRFMSGRTWPPYGRSSS